MAEWAYPYIVHGADYYPEQWLDRPDILQADLRLMQKAHINTVTLGVFAWSAQEPEEGVYTLDWLQQMLDRLYQSGIRALLATPSGARPPWLAQKYPEVLRVAQDRQRNLYGMRMNHCYTSPAYRKLVQAIDTELARRFAGHPAVIGWHISNEYHGECHCPLCQAAFREYLREKYETLDALNGAWWTAFWSKRYTAWEQIESPSARGERAVHGLALDWLRFVTRQTRDFMAMEAAAVRPYNPALPITTNMIGKLIEIDSPRFADLLDIAAMDVYPMWRGGDNEDVADETAFEHDLTRGIKRKPYLLAETTPSISNWQEVCQPKRPGVHMLCAMQAVAHGADAFMMFQWRQSMGGFEKFHGAVVGHDGRDDTRVFREVAQAGKRLEALSAVAGSVTDSKAALLFDWNNRWAIREAKGPRGGIDPDQTALKHYQALARQAVNIDIIDTEQPFDGYRLIAAPMLYMLKPGVLRRLEAFVRQGGTLIATYLSGVTDENDLCFPLPAPGPLGPLMGITGLELDSLYPGQQNTLVPTGSSFPTTPAACGFLCQVLRADTAQVRAVYGSEFYAGTPALTENAFGKGSAWYLAADIEQQGLDRLYAHLVDSAGVPRLLQALPQGVRAHARTGKDGAAYLFLLNFSGEERRVTLPECKNAESGAPLRGETPLRVHEALIVRLESHAANGKDDV